MKTSIEAERHWEAIQVNEEHESGWGGAHRLALVLVEHPIEILEIIEVSGLDEVTGAGKGLLLEGGQEEPIIEDEQAKAKGKHRA